MRRFLSVLAVALLFGACRTPQTRTKAERLHKAVETYNKAYRWQNFEVASGYLPAEERPLFITTYEDDRESLSISDYRILKVDKPTEDAAVVTVRYRYTMLPSTSVKKRQVTQRWHHVGERWVLESEEDSIRKLSLETKAPTDPDLDEAEIDPDTAQ